MEYVPIGTRIAGRCVEGLAASVQCTVLARRKPTSLLLANVADLPALSTSAAAYDTIGVCTSDPNFRPVPDLQMHCRFIGHTPPRIGL